jgi:beta-phosphoglucomutase
MHVDGIIFDMDGVLCDSEPFICEAACRMFRDRHQVTVRAEDFRPFVGTGENRFIGGVADAYGVTLDLEADKAYTYAVYLELIQGRLEPMNGAAAFISLCRACGLKLAVASSADLIKVQGNLAAIGLPMATFDTVVNGLMVARKKPHPDIFLLAAERLGLAPAACLVVEDAPAGVAAARAAGAWALGVRSSFDAAALTAAGAHWTVQDLAEACELLGTRLARRDGF